MSQPLKVTTRQATVADSHLLAQITASGFIDDDVTGRFMHPKRREYPEDWLHQWKRHFETDLAEPTHRAFLTIDESNGHPAGMVLLQRFGSDAENLPNPPELQAEKASIKDRHAEEDKTWTDRSADPQAVELFEHSVGDIAHFWTGARSQAWHILYLCVHKDYWYQGLGQPLVAKAIEQGKQETPMVPVSVIASKMGDRFYKKWGFEETGSAVVGRLAGNDLEGGIVYFYEKHLQ